MNKPIGFILLLLFAINSIADDSKPLFIQIDQTASTQAVPYLYQVYIKVPQTAKVPMDATLTTPMFCSQPSATTRQITSDNSLLKKLSSSMQTTIKRQRVKRQN